MPARGAVVTRRQLTLHLLREAGGRGVTTSEFLEGGCGSRFGGRILELREQGHMIETERVREGSFRYTLTFDVERDTTTRPVDPGMASIPNGDGVSPGADPRAPTAPDSWLEPPARNAPRPTSPDVADHDSPAAPPAPPPKLFDPPPRRANYMDVDDLEAA